MYGIKETKIWTISIGHWGCIQVNDIDDYTIVKFRVHIF